MNTVHHLEMAVQKARAWRDSISPVVGFDGGFNEQTGRMESLTASQSGGVGMAHEHIRMVLTNDLSEISKLHRELRNFGERSCLSERTLFELNLILEEVLANVIAYAYEDNQQHEIVVQADVSDGELVVEVEDDGRPFNPLQIPPPDLERPLAQRKVGGLGLHLVRELTSSIEYARKDGKNRLVMKQTIAERQRRDHRT